MKGNVTHSLDDQVAQDSRILILCKSESVLNKISYFKFTPTFKMEIFAKLVND